MTKTYNNKGVCARSVTFDIAEDGTVTNVSFVGGCNGNLKGVAALAEGRKAQDIIKQCRGITCGPKTTSCPDQFAQALEQALEEI